MNNEFKKINNNNITRYVLEDGSSGGATSGSTSAGSISSFEKPMGGVQRRTGDDLIHQENKKSYKVSHKPKNPVAKAHQTVGTGSGAHTDKTKTLPRKEKHKKPADMTMENFNAEYDDEAGMAYGSLHTLKRAVDGLMNTIDNKDNLPEWCQEKISLAEDYLVTVWDYLQSEKEQGLAEDYRDSLTYGQDSDWDNMLLRREARRKGMSVDQYKQYLEKQKQDQDHELNIGSAGRAELKQKADELAEIKREKLRNERLHDEETAFQRAETVQQRKDEMQKIADKYKHDLTVIDKEHRNNMEAIRTGNSHETNKMSMEFQHEKEMWDRNNSPEKPQSQYEPEMPMQEPDQDPNDDNFDQDTGEPLKPGFTRPQQRPPASNQWHTSQQVGYKPTKPTKPSNNDDIVDVEPKPNNQLRLKEKITVVNDPKKATGIQTTGGITHGSVYAGKPVSQPYRITPGATHSPGKPLPQSLQQKLDGGQSTGRAVDAKGRTQQQWIQAVKQKFPDAKVMVSKMIDGPCFAMLADGRKLSWNKVEQGVAEGNRGYAHGFASPTAPQLGQKRKDNDSGDSEPAGMFTVMIDGRPWKEFTSNMAFDRAKAFATKNPDRKVQVRWPSGQLNTVKEDNYMESLNAKLAEKLDPNAEPEVWVQDFQKANPNKYHQFKNKTPQKKAQMAVAARRDARLKK